jgi:hypothetical protein
MLKLGAIVGLVAGVAMIVGCSAGSAVTPKPVAVPSPEVRMEIRVVSAVRPIVATVRHLVLDSEPAPASVPALDGVPTLVMLASSVVEGAVPQAGEVGP